MRELYKMKLSLIAILLVAISSCETNEPKQKGNADEPGKQVNANGVEYVDLGLSVKWASCNVGAKSPEDPGFLFAWGEVEPKELFGWDVDYRYSEKNRDPESGQYKLTKYCTNLDYGVKDDITILEEEDDAAHFNMGGSWRTPTSKEIGELFRCEREYVTVNGNYCVKFTGPNGNYILIPGRSEAYYPPVRTENPEYGGIWSSTLCVLYEQAQNNAYALEFHPARPTPVIEVTACGRRYGFAVRGVLE